MTFNVADFASNIARYGTLQTNKFEVIINDNASSRPQPQSDDPNIINIVPGRRLFTRIRNDTERVTDDEAFSMRIGATIASSRIDSIRMPGVMIDTFETKRYGVGPNIKAGTNVRFEPFSISVLVDKNYDLYKYFHIWINTVFGGAGRISGPDGPGLFPTFLTSYKKDYATEVDVKVFENTGETKALYKFYDAFPIAITNPTLNWRDNNNLFKFDVTFSYTNWEVSNNPSLGNRGLSDVRTIIQQARTRPETQTP
jgi:hypothetical protein